MGCASAKNDVADTRSMLLHSYKAQGPCKGGARHTARNGAKGATDHFTIAQEPRSP